MDSELLGMVDESEEALEDVACLPDGSGCFVLEFEPDEGFVDFLAADEDTGEIDPLQLAIGILVELERCGGFEEAEAEAISHIGENECYYGECDELTVASPEGDGGVIDGLAEGDEEAFEKAGLLTPVSGLGVPEIPSVFESFRPSEVTSSVCPYWRDKLAYYLVRSSRYLGNNKYSFSYGNLFGDYTLIPVVGGYEVKAHDSIGAFASSFQPERRISSYFNLERAAPTPYVLGSALFYFVDSQFVPLNSDAVREYAFIRSCYEGGSPDEFMDSVRKTVYSRKAMLSSALDPLDVSSAAYRRSKRIPLFSDEDVNAFAESEGIDKADLGEWVDKGRDDAQRIADARAYFDAQGNVPTYNDFKGYLEFAGDYEDELGARALYDKLVKDYEDEGTFLVDETGKPVDSSREAWRLFTGLVKQSKAFSNIGFNVADSIALFQIYKTLPRGAGFGEFLEEAKACGIELDLDRQSKVLSRVFDGRLGGRSLRRPIRQATYEARPPSYDGFVDGCMAQLRNYDRDAARWFKASEARMRTFRDIVLEYASVFKAAKAASEYYEEAVGAGVQSRRMRSHAGRRGARVFSGADFYSDMRAYFREVRACTKVVDSAAEGTLFDLMYDLWDDDTWGERVGSIIEDCFDRGEDPWDCAEKLSRKYRDGSLGIVSRAGRRSRRYGIRHYR